MTTASRIFFTLTACILFLTLNACTMQQASSPQFLDNQVIAHRGAWKAGQLPQNSMASLHEAIRLGCAGAEFDVSLTKDDVLVVNHDPDFLGIDVATSTYPELLAKKLMNGESIPTARDYLIEGMKQKKTKLILELKTSLLGRERTLYSADLAVALVKELGAGEWVEYILFDYDAARRIIELDPQAKVWYLKGDVAPRQARADGFYGIDYHFTVFRDEQPTWLQEAKDVGLAVNAWTVNSREEMIRLLDQNVEFITTDEPELLFEVLAER